MEPALGDLQPVVRPFTRHPVHEPVLVGDAARPPALEVAVERLGLAGPLVGRAAAFPDQVIEPPEHLSVGVLPVEIVLPGGIREDDFHAGLR